MRLSLTQAIQRLLAEEVLAIPTETVYGLAASLSSEKSIDQVFALKKRPLTNPLIIHTASCEQIFPLIQSLPKGFEELSEAFWPGPLTLILPIQEEKILPRVRANLPTAAFRIPSLKLTRELLQATGPLIAPSANLSGTPSSTSPEHVERDFGADFPVLDGGKAEHGLESTILAFKEGEWRLARLGAIPAEAFLLCLGYMPKPYKGSENAPLCPGQHFRHYAPKARLHLESDFSQASLVLGFSDRSYPVRSISLGSSNDPEEAAKRLYDALRQLDLDQEREVWVDMDFPDTGLWASIRERLLRASEAG